MSEKLSDVVTIISGGTPKTSVKEFWDGNIDWLAVADFNSSNRYVSSASKKITELGLNNSNTKMLEKGDLIISARGTVGAIAQLTKPMAFNQSCFGLRGKKNKLDTDYLYYWLKNYVDVLLNKSQGSVFNTINLSTFDDIKIELPSIADQRKISNLLTLLDDKIEINNPTKSWKPWLRPSMTTGLCSLIFQTRMANPTNHQAERWSITQNSNAKSQKGGEWILYGI